MSTPTTSVVIRSLNEGRHLNRLLAGLSRQLVPVDEIVLVDSGSTDDTVEIARRHSCTIVTITSSEFSFGRALNRGCEAASGDILLILSAHVYPVYDTYVGQILRPFTEPEVAVAYGRQVGDDRTRYSESRLMLKWFPQESAFDQGHAFSNNANAAVRREAWSGLRYDEDLTGLEDLEFAHRALGQGMRISYVAEAPVVHVHEETWDAIRNRYRREAIAYAKITGQGSFSVAAAARLAAGNMFSDYVSASRDRRLLSNIVDIPLFRFAQFAGAWEGLRDRGEVTDELKRRFYYPTGRKHRMPTAEPGSRIDYSDLDQ